MKHCPNPDCESIITHGVVAEYRDEVQRCVHCESVLADGPVTTVKPQVQWIDQVQIRSFSEPHEAFTAQSLLSSEGIRSFLANVHTSGVAWPYAAVAGGVQLHVQPQDVERALELLSSAGGLAAEVASRESHPLDEACPRCRSLELEPFARTRKWVASIGALLGFLLPAAKKHALRCRACGLEYYP